VGVGGGVLCGGAGYLWGGDWGSPSTEDRRGAEESAPRVVRFKTRGYFSPISFTLTFSFRAAWAAASLAMGTR
jgi:hypothetical protein